MTEEISAASVYAPFACPVVFFTVWPRIPVNTVYTCQSISKYAYLAKIIRNFGAISGARKNLRLDAWTYLLYLYRSDGRRFIWFSISGFLFLRHDLLCPSKKMVGRPPVA